MLAVNAPPPPSIRVLIAEMFRSQNPIGPDRLNHLMSTALTGTCGPVVSSTSSRSPWSMIRTSNVRPTSYPAG